MSATYDPMIDEGFEDELAPVEDDLDAAPLPDDGEAEPPLAEDETDPVTGLTRDDAIAGGWRPLEDFQGEPRLWRDWPEFLRRGYEDPRILRERNATLMKKTTRLERQLGDTQAELATMKGQVGELLAITKQTQKSAYEQRRDALLAQRREAVENSDTSAFDRIEAELQREAAPVAATETPAAAPRFHPAITEFVEANPWWTEDLDLQRAMNAHYDVIQRSRKDLDIDAQLALAKRRLMADFPDKFGGAPVATTPRPRPAADPRRPAAAGVARPTGGAALGRPRQPTSGWDTIPDAAERAEAKAAFESQRRADPGLTEDEYLTIYHDPHADPLELRRQRKPA